MERKGPDAQSHFDDILCGRYRCRKHAVNFGSQEGFSLLEMLIGLALTALMLQAMLPLLATSVLSWKAGVARTTVHQSARLTLEAMTRDLRFASIIAWPPPGQSDSRISFQKIENDGSTNTIIFQRGLSSGLNQKTLYRTNTPGQPTPLTQDVVSDLSFEYDEPRLVKINMTVTDAETGMSDSVTAAIVCVNVLD